MPKDTKSSGNNKAPACESRGFGHKKEGENFDTPSLYGESLKIQKFVDWLASNYKYGIHGDPCNWKEYNLPKMDIYEG